MKFCALFYAVLCVFSIVTGIMYALGKRKLNPLELSDKILSKLDTEEKEDSFARKMGVVTVIVGIVQGITSYALYKAGNTVNYIIGLGFTVFSLLSVSYKLKGRVSSFAVTKAVFYVGILVIIILNKGLF